MIVYRVSLLGSIYTEEYHLLCKVNQCLVLYYKLYTRNVIQSVFHGQFED